MPSRHRPIPGSQPCPRHRPASARGRRIIELPESDIMLFGVPPDGKGGANQATVEGEAAGGEKIADRVFNKAVPVSRLSNILAPINPNTAARSPYLLPCRAPDAQGALFGFGQFLLVLLAHFMPAKNKPSTIPAGQLPSQEKDKLLRVGGRGLLLIKRR